MGEVYLAQDSVLDRKVAIKFLSPKLNENEQARKRLLREAKAAAQLDHPNICAIYEVGEESGVSFIAMQYVDGETLASKNVTNRPSVSEAVNIAIQVADALADAHSHGILHRDIKPENIIIAPKGHVKVLDFGLAKKLDEDYLGTDADTLSIVSQSGALIGTVPYMSPEQVRAEKLDGRSDIFSIGTVLYEMLSGKQPFITRSPAQSIAAILTSDPQPLKSSGSNIPAELERVVFKCLEKDKERRYQSARELLVDLRNVQSDLQSTISVRKSRSLHSLWSARTQTLSAPGRLIALLLVIGALIFTGWYLFIRKNAELTGASPGSINSIAVLPFANQSGDPEIDYLCDGLTETLINSFAQIPDMRVIARSSVFHYKDQNVNPQVVGSELNVQALLIGRVVRHGDDFFTTMELVDVSSNSRLWGEQYNRKPANLLSIQAEITKSVFAKLRPSVGENDALARYSTDNTEAYQLYLKGRYQWNKRTVDSLAKAVDFFQQAIQKDPSYAPAYAGLADAYLANSVLPPKETARLAREAAVKALALDQNLAEAHASLGFVAARYDWNWTEAEKEYQRALQLNPNSVVARFHYADYLEVMGKQTEAFEVLKQAQQIDPLSEVVNAELCTPMIFDHHYDRAKECFQKTLDLEPNYWQAHYYLGLIHHLQGSHEDSIKEFQMATNFSGESPSALGMLGYAYASSGKKAKAREILTKLNELSKRRNVLPFNMAMVYFGLGQRDEAFKWMEKSYEEHDPSLVLIKLLPLFEKVQSDPRFSEIVRGMGLSR